MTVELTGQTKYLCRILASLFITIFSPKTEGLTCTGDNQECYYRGGLGFQCAKIVL